MQHIDRKASLSYTNGWALWLVSWASLGDDINYLPWIHTLPDGANNNKKYLLKCRALTVYVYIYKYIYIFEQGRRQGKMHCIRNMYTHWLGNCIVLRKKNDSSKYFANYIWCDSQGCPRSREEFIASVDCYWRDGYLRDGPVISASFVTTSDSIACKLLTHEINAAFNSRSIIDACCIYNFSLESVSTF